MVRDKKSGQYHQRIVKEEHDCLYKMHFTPPPGIPSSKPSKEVVKDIFEWLQGQGRDRDILVIGGDSSNSMTGWQGWVG